MYCLVRSSIIGPFILALNVRTGCLGTVWIKKGHPTVLPISGLNVRTDRHSPYQAIYGADMGSLECAWACLPSRTGRWGSRQFSHICLPSPCLSNTFLFSVHPPLHCRHQTSTGIGAPPPSHQCFATGRPNAHCCRPGRHRTRLPPPDGFPVRQTPPYFHPMLYVFDDMPEPVFDSFGHYF